MNPKPGRTFPGAEETEMGYSHYWYVNPDGDQRQWSAALLAVTRIIQQSPVPLGNWEGKGQPELANDGIRLNGCADRDEDCETFALPTVLRTAGRQSFDFCKTYRLPYDVVITAVLATLAYLAPDCIRVSSDGEASDWADGLALASAVLGEPIALPTGVLT